MPFTRFERWRPDAGVDLFLKDANVFPVVSSIILQLGDFGSQFLDLPILVIHVLLDAICECTPVRRFLGCCFNLSMSSISEIGRASCREGKEERVVGGSGT